MDVAGLILAGGRARRFGERPKALAILGGVAMIEHVIERLSPQVTSLVLSVDERNAMFNTLQLQQIEDPEPGKKGPLAALLSGLRWLQASGGEWLQMAPCDTPFLPTDLVGRLALHVRSQQAEGCVPRFRGRLHPACGLWNISLVPSLERAISEGLQGFKEFLEAHPVAVLEWPEPHAGEPDPFFNVNTPEQLRQAEREL
ncbi:MAG: molybdenum cofactor guanylyltransferase MobA [Xanthomonadales bacterium]|nr:molybdenum cofactor guanylyltransferase MobA [Xanthomonadales bacterium]